jgi:16S rRNA (adenine1518-N6/adenine1519-N6)-dimethyltransferase
MQVEKGGVVARTVFVPQPDVASALVVMTPALPSSVPVQDEATFFRVVRAGFGQRRKTLANALDALEGANRTGVLAALASAGIDPMRRAETLSLREFAALADAIAAADAARG